MQGYGNRVLVLIVAALLPVAVLGSVLVIDVAQRERQRLEREARDHVRALVARLDAEIESHVRALAVLAASPLLDDGDLSRFREHARRAQERQPLWRNILLATPDGAQRLNLRFPIGDAAVRVDGFAAFEAVLRSGQAVIGGVGPGPGSDEMRVPIRVPVQREGRMRFVLTAALDLTAIARLLDTVLPRGWRGAIVDGEGRIVARSSDGAASAGQLASASARQAAAADRGGEFRRGASREGAEYAVLFLESPRTGWTVHAGLPVASLSVLQTGSVLFAAGGALVSILLAGLLSWLLVRELRIRRRREAVLAESQHLEALGRLTGGVAHDFNNLLMIMQGGAEAIKRRRSDPDQVATYADGMASAAQRGAALTRQLLAYARREAQAPRTFHLKDRADDLRVLLTRSTGPDIRTSLAIPDDAWPIFADPNALEVAVINLATNARDAMPDGGQLSVSVANVSLRPGHDEGTGLAGDYVVVTVADTGSGIAESHLARIFEPFFTTKPSGQGTGLGLSQVYGFARQSGGAVTVRSAMGEGAAFRLYLPRSAEAARPPAAAARPANGADGGRVLLVEDNADVAHATESMLAAAGYSVTAAGSAEAALDVLRRDARFDVVLSDIVMNGGMSGLDLAARLRDHGHAPPVVLMTGYSEALANGTNGGGVRVLAKPFSQAELISALRAAREEPA